jgi:hypothetical protein
VIQIQVTNFTYMSFTTYTFLKGLSLCCMADLQNCREWRNYTEDIASQNFGYHLRSDDTALEPCVRLHKRVVTWNIPSASVFICKSGSAVYNVYCLAALQNRDHGFRFLAEHNVCTQRFAFVLSRSDIVDSTCL